LVTSEIGAKDHDLPGFVSIGGASAGSGFLPVSYGPFRVQDPEQMPSNSEITVSSARYNRRLALLGNLERTYSQAGAAGQVEDHAGVYQQASRLATSPKLAAFDVKKEPEKVLSKYGDSSFGKGCLLARRLVETGVTYVEVTLNGWDTHNDGHDRVKALAGRCDVAYAALLADLKERGMLDRTLVVWMGEFGRTPRVNPNAGRDHFPRAFSVAVSGCGVRGGQVIGKTDATGASVAERPVGVTDLFYSFAKLLGIDPAKENQSPIGRPLKIVDGGQMVSELTA
jgi:uncharacterized protein (DUF1501 family)